MTAPRPDPPEPPGSPELVVTHERAELPEPLEPPEPHDPVEPVEAYRARAATWVRRNLAPITPELVEEQLRGDGRSARGLQRLLHDAGYAGICWPSEYGGQGLPPHYQLAFNEVVAGRQMPLALNMTLGIVGPTLLELGSEDQKRRFLPAILRGEAIWAQLLSEPTGGSDLAGVRTRADRDGEGFTLTGTKTWTSRADRADWAVCLARTDWSVPKHQGLTMFLVPLRDPRIEIRPIRKADGDEGFCEEFLDGVWVGANLVLGEIDGGWSVVQTMLTHERAALGGASTYLSGDGYQAAAALGGEERSPLVADVRASGRAPDPHVRQLVAEDHTTRTVARLLAARIREGLSTGQMPAAAGAVIRLSAAVSHVVHARTAFELAGTSAVMWPRGDGQADAGGHDVDGGGGGGHGLDGADGGQRIGLDYLVRQAQCLGGGSVEMQRNIISERLLGMPREPAPDRGRPFREIRHN